ncbi:FAD/NAD(P)-binding protein [Glarea lozoyensis ATCC 20868]|uniref:FAD/NAD(P)-binding protein n=1 Tax=Glarea lozoyensis (strain ATCC 20868 / MF5171) TaxID=1116229 RepID=S3CJU9_GLAL2|nr:FAD/NAD(P)-binding protein [Glarea lozoyensis ATCC 20868]EPE26080.1 FAD/NAD(P)-binding protein [Glarea lozoyensis ATCC 20868]
MENSNSVKAPLTSVVPLSKFWSYWATVYYPLARGRSNLQVLTGCTVQRIVFVILAPNIRATDVHYLSDIGFLAQGQTSTCSMLPKKNAGVADENLLVYGTSNLRIIDATIFPLIIRGTPQAAMHAVAERAADIIKTCHGTQLRRDKVLI